MGIRGPQLASLDSSAPLAAVDGAPAAASEPSVGGGPIVFFDGVCGLCNRFIDFVIKRDRAGVFRFAPLQGETARERLPAADVRDVNTMVLVDEQGVFRKSTAATRILLRLGGAWSLVGGTLRLIPPPLRDAGYSLVARYRYRIFGKKETCRMPTPAERGRFLP
jgi:predicted DCC family thiol-disulfide oxidoreductase YuxK